MTLLATITTFLACIALALSRQRDFNRLMLDKSLSITQSRGLLVAACMLLTVSLIANIFTNGTATGIVMFLGILSIAIVCTALLITYSNRIITPGYKPGKAHASSTGKDAYQGSSNQKSSRKGL